MQVYILLLFCQIADFGLSRKLDDDTVYYVTSGGMVPVNWTAPEVYIYASTAALQGRTSVLSYPHVYINNHLRIRNQCVLSGPCTKSALCLYADAGTMSSYF